ncbi:MAG: aminotransferase class III-fold pyridoxal phosphate-dependent enzyme [Desulfobacterales bacterium]|nr:aminotransferase class III-fold pyridoxal phosphate-dependent enzyme [Desulfobacterales bacterium]
MKLNLKKSLDMQNRARNCIPGMTQLLSKRPDMFAPGVWPGYFSHAKGAEVWDLDGNHYIDMSIAGIGANVLGYSDIDVNEAVKKSIDNGTSCSLNCTEEVELADLLCELHPWAEMVRFARTGGESMAIAIRIARAYTGKDKIAFCGYHGWHDWYLSANLETDTLGNHLLAGLDPAGVPKGLAGTAIPFRYNQIEELQAIVMQHKEEIAAIVMEPIRSEQPKQGFFDEVRAIANEIGAVFVIDEISAGFRMNTGGAHLLLGISPDIAVFSKALGNGYPIAAVIGKRDIMDAAQKTFISSTNWTERIGPTAAIAMIEKHRKLNVGKYLIEIGNLVQNGWKNLSEKNDLKINIGGIPPLSHFIFQGNNPLAMKSLFVQLMLEKGFLASTLFYSMYAHTSEHVDVYLKSVDKAFAEISDACHSGDLEKRMKGKPASSGFKRLN